MSRLDSKRSQSPLAALPPDHQCAGKVGHYRWIICAMLFFATAINYLDRSVLNAIEPELKKPENIGWTATQYGYINAAFLSAYALGFLIFGWFIDRVGARIGYAVSLTAWCLAAAGHALARTPFGFGVARFALGLGEAGNSPANVKTVAEWFPQRERALSIGILSAGGNIGAFLAPLVAPLLLIHFGWQSAFLVTGLLGLIWVFFWIPIYRPPEEHPRISPAERAYILSDPAEKPRKVRWLHLIPHRQTWAFVSVKLLTDPVWWFYMFCSGKFVAERFGVNISHIGPPLVVTYLLADVGSIAGGWLSSSLMKRGWTANAARKTTMLICCLCVLPVIYAPITHHLWVAVILVGIAMAAHQGFSANLFATTADMFPKRAVGSIVGFGGMAGAASGIPMQIFAGRIKDATGSYLIMFIVAGTIYLLAMGVFHLLAPGLEKVELSDDSPREFPVSANG